MEGGDAVRIALCDDEEQERKHFAEALHEWSPDYRPECFSSGDSLLAAAAAPNREPFSIVFLDIYLPRENGVEIAKELKKISPETSIVFVTTSQEHAVDAFSLQALHYLIKPVTMEGIEEAFRRLAQLQGPKRTMMALTIGRDNVTLYMDEIIFLQSVKHAVEIFLTNDRQFKIWAPLNELEQRLNENFLKINRGTIVNMEQIEQMGADACVLRSGIRLDFPRRERGTIRNAYDNFLFSRLSQRKGFGGEMDR